MQICFGVYTLEAVVRWVGISSDEYWKNCWSALDLTVVLIYWIGFTVMHTFSYQNYYLKFCGMLMVKNIIYF